MDPIINYRRLDREAPHWRELELDYRPDVKVKNEQINTTVFSVILIYVLAVGFSLMTVADDDVLAIVSATVLSTVFSFLPFIGIGIVLYTRGDWKLALGWCLGILLVPAFLFLMIVIAGFWPTRMLMHVAILLFTGYFVDRFAKHFHYWLTASHRLPSEVRRQHRQWFTNRFSPSKLSSAYRECKDAESRFRKDGDEKSAGLVARRALELKALTAYRRGFILAVALYFLIPTLLEWIPLWASLIPFIPYKAKTVAVLVLVPTVFAIVRSRRLAPRYASFLRLLRVLGHATVSWFTYAQNAENVPGVFASPAGPRGHRAMLALITFSLLPTAWTYIVLNGSLSRDDLYLSLIVGALFSPIFLYTVILFTAGPILLLAYRAFNEAGDRAEHDDSITDWEAYVRRLQASKTPLESDHLWLGIHPIEDFPVILHRDILQEHAYIVGDSGSGKTALGITPIVSQLIRQRNAAIVILDLKGDASLFQAAQAEAAQAGAEFKFFTNELNRATHIFNPFGLADSQHISLNQLCEIFLEALSLNHGEGYGRSYFSRMARHWLAGALRKNPDLSSFEELYEYTRKKGAFQNAEERERVFELISVIESLATFEQLNLTPARSKDHGQAAEHAIHMTEVIAEKQVVYFWLPAAVEAATVREIAKLALYSLMNAAYFADRSHDILGELLKDKLPERAQTYLVIDEFQRIASGNFKIILEQARSMGIGAILANQTFADLVTPESDLRPTVESNTRVKLCFSATDLDQQERIIKASGETKDWQFGYSSTPQGRTFSWTQQIVPRIRRNNVIEISDDPFFAVCQIVRGSGYSQYSGYSIPIRTGHAISREEYQRRLAAPWPEKTEKTIVVRRAPLPEKPFATVEQRLEAAQEAYQEPEKPATNAEPAASVSEPVSPWAERLEKLRSSLYPEKEASS